MCHEKLHLIGIYSTIYVFLTSKIRRKLPFFGQSLRRRLSMTYSPVTNKSVESVLGCVGLCHTEITEIIFNLLWAEVFYVTQKYAEIRRNDFINEISVLSAVCTNICI